uniref:Putative tick metalloprotease n=1 Tax=Ixodes ricinus TaxID=34613 RepID=V5H3C1_IXORI
MMWYIFLCVLSALLQNASARGVSRNFEVAYPKLLGKQRPFRVEKVIHIKEGLILHLEKTSILSENLVLTDLSGKKPVVTPMNGKYMERNLYHDKEKMAAVEVKENNGAVEVSGVISDTLRITSSSFLWLELKTGLSRTRFSKLMGQLTVVMTTSKQVAINWKSESMDIFFSPPKQVQVPDPFLIETLVVADEYFYANFDNDTQLSNISRHCYGGGRTSDIQTTKQTKGTTATLVK